MLQFPEEKEEGEGEGLLLPWSPVKCTRKLNVPHMTKKGSVWIFRMWEDLYGAGKDGMGG